MLTLKFLKMGEEKKGEAHKRAHLRAKSANLLKLNPSDKFSKGVITNIIDLSEEGLQFFSKDPVEPHTTLQMVINLMEKKKQISVVGEVRWVRPAKEKGVGYQAGVLFTQIDYRDKELLREFIEQEEKKYEK